MRSVMASSIGQFRRRVLDSRPNAAAGRLGSAGSGERRCDPIGLGLFSIIDSDHRRHAQM